MEDRGAAGTWSGDAERHARESDAAAAVAELMGGNAMSSPVEISVKCRGLPDRDVLSKSDPMAVLLAGSDPRGTAWSEVARTEVVANTLNPAFTKQLLAIYTFERLQPMRLLVVDADVRGDAAALKLEQQDFLGARAGRRRQGLPAGWCRGWQPGPLLPQLLPQRVPRQLHARPLTQYLPPPPPHPPPGEASFLLSDLLTSPGQRLQLQLVDRARRPLRGAAVELRAEELPASNAVVEMAVAALKLDNKVGGDGGADDA